MLKLKSFKEFTINESAVIQNKHSTHLEDLILDGGKTATSNVIKSLGEIYDKFASTTKNKDIGVSVKFDGAPAVFFGYNPDPENNKFFVGTKAIFNKNPKINYTDSDIDSNHTGDLAEKLKVCLRYLKSVTPNNGEMYQGDLMFTKGDLKKLSSGDEEMVFCHPNTIVYAVPTSSKLAKKWLGAQVGIVVHTRYMGGSIADMSATFGVSADEFSNSKNVWMEDAYYKSYDGVVTFTDAESKEYKKLLSQATKIASSITGSTYSKLQGDINSLINTYNNTYIRENKRNISPQQKATNFTEYVNMRFKKEIDKRKTEKGKQTQIDKRDIMLKGIPDIKQLTKVYELQDTVVALKEMVLSKLDRVDSLSTFVLTKGGVLKVTGAEGYVGLSDGNIPQGVKLVDRYSFSFNNFSPEIKKGWESSSRN